MNVIMLNYTSEVCYRMMVDKLLIWRFKLGSRDALRRIYDKYHRELLKLAICLTGEPNTAEDIVHDVFCSFAQSVGRISPAGSIKGYLITSTVNRVRNYRRDRNRRAELTLDETISISSGQRRPEQWAILGEQLECLARAMTDLPYEQREAVMLRTQSDMTFRKIADLQQTTVSTVQGRYRYGIEKLRLLLNGELYK
jgi:RNA polymerase sigma-70 factor (ECF subfamily)